MVCSISPTTREDEVNPSVKELPAIFWGDFNCVWEDGELIDVVRVLDGRLI
jgi:hypothetical protein